mgnify:CR=1 FL=1
MAKTDLTNKKIQDTFQTVVQVGTSPTGSITPYLYDLEGHKITGIKMQEAFERDGNGDIQPTTGSFHDMFWEEDGTGNKQPKDIKFWLDENYNLITIPGSE